MKRLRVRLAVPSGRWVVEAPGMALNVAGESSEAKLDKDEALESEWESDGNIAEDGIVDRVRRGNQGTGGMRRVGYLIPRG